MIGRDRFAKGDKVEIAMGTYGPKGPFLVQERKKSYLGAHYYELADAATGEVFSAPWEALRKI